MYYCTLLTDVNTNVKCYSFIAIIKVYIIIFSLKTINKRMDRYT